VTDRLITEKDIDYKSIMLHGGANEGNEDFAFIQCPSCGHIYLIESEVDTIYLDSNNLSVRKGFYSGGDVVHCVNCGNKLTAVEIWAAIRKDIGTELWQVSWKKFMLSPWNWAAKLQI
jgi:ribosomal protein S27E